MRAKRVRALRKQVDWHHGGNRSMVVQQVTKDFTRWIAKNVQFRMYRAAKRLYSRGWMVEG